MYCFNIFKMKAKTRPRAIEYSFKSVKLSSIAIFKIKYKILKQTAKNCIEGKIFHLDINFKKTHIPKSYKNTGILFSNCHRIYMSVV